jgi:hypothetical protein
MQRKRLLVLLAAIAVASVIVSVVGLSDTIYTWEKTFEVKKPEVECEIEIGDNKIVGCPVKVWVCLKLENGWRDCCWHEWKNECNDDLEDKCDDYKDCWECCCHVNGTYSVDLQWYNETSEDWEHVKHLQEEKNITTTCFRYMQTYMFIPMWEGEYKVVVTLAVNSEIYNFTNEN